MKSLYKIISLIFQPLLIPTYGMMLLMNMDIFQFIPLIGRLIAIIGTFFFTGLMPALPIILMIRKGQVSDLFISRREERTMPYLFSFLAYVFWAMFMWRTLQFPDFIVAMGFASAISIFVIVLINTKWKVSAHLAGMGGLVGAVFGVCFRLAVNPVWFFAAILAFSAFVAISRVALKAHTPAQTLAGFVIGFVLVFCPSLIF